MSVLCKFCGVAMKAIRFSDSLECRHCGALAGTWIDSITRDRVAEVAA